MPNVVDDLVKGSAVAGHVDFQEVKYIVKSRLLEAPRGANVRGAPAVAGVSPALPPGVTEANAKEAVLCNDMMRVYANIAARDQDKAEGQIDGVS